MIPKVSVVIPNYNGMAYLNNCIESLLMQDVFSFEIIIVDDGSTDGSYESAKRHYPASSALPVIRYIRHQENGGFCKAVNTGITAAKADYVILLNNDTVVDSKFVRNLYRAILKNKNTFSVSARMIKLHNKKELDDTGDLYCALGWAFAPAKDKSVNEYLRAEKIFASCGGAAIYDKQLLYELGMFDENHFAYLEDIDIGYRAKLAGYQNMYEPTAVVYHAGSAVSGSRHNAFKVKLSAKNSIYLAYKNMAPWQLAVNCPFLLAGIAVKTVYFLKKGLVKPYIQGIKEGFQLVKTPGARRHQVNFNKVPLSRQLTLEGELLFNMLRRLAG